MPTTTTPTVFTSHWPDVAIPTMTLPEFLLSAALDRAGEPALVDGRGGALFIVDRVKELIKVKGFQVAPAELEAVLRTHAGVADAAVVAIPDERTGEVPKAFVVRAGGADALTAEEVMAYVSERVAPHKRVRAVEFIDAIPTSPAGKTLRRLLRVAA